MAALDTEEEQQKYHYRIMSTEMATHFPDSKKKITNKNLPRDSLPPSPVCLAHRYFFHVFIVSIKEIPIVTFTYIVILFI